MQQVIKINTKEFAIEAAGGQIVSVRNKDITKAGARIFSDGYVYSSSFVGEIGDDELVENAKKNEEGRIAFDYEITDQGKKLKEICLNENADIKQAFLKEYNQRLSTIKEKFPNLIFSGKANYTRENRTLNDMQSHYDEFVWYFMFRHKDSASIIDGYFGSGSIGNWEFEKEINRYIPFLDIYENIVTIDNGTYPVIFASSAQLVSKLAESSRIDLYKKGTVIFNDKLGKKIVNEKVTLQDVSYDPELCAVAPFDGEGFIRDNYKLNIIENGVFKTLISDARNAKKYGVPATGNGQRNFDSGVLLGTNTLTLAAGQKPTEDILNSLDKCLVIEMAGGGDFTDSGDFSSPVQVGFMLENGKVTGRLPQITIKSSLQRMFGEDLVEVGSDYYSGLDHCPGFVTKMEVLNN